MKARDRFEAYMIAAGVNEGFLARSTSRPGHYVDFVVNVEWSAWQAAEAATARRCVEVASQHGFTDAAVDAVFTNMRAAGVNPKLNEN